MNRALQKAKPEEQGVVELDAGDATPSAAALRIFQMAQAAKPVRFERTTREQDGYVGVVKK
jgi:hypothetical protein